MATYRVYFIDRANRISRPPEVLECANDQEAIQKAQQFIDGQDIELWQEDRFLVRYPSK